jgi:outer membrane cobalamin receptor
MFRVVTGLVAGCLVSVCFAQEDAVVVTAPRFDEDVRRLPASVTVINAEDIAKSSARTIPELLGEQVGFTQKDLFGNNAADLVTLYERVRASSGGVGAVNSAPQSAQRNRSSSKSAALKMGWATMRTNRAGTARE